MVKRLQNLAEKATELVTKWPTSNVLFHRMIGVIYLAAFYGLYIQFRGLYGWNGLLPVESHVTSIRNHFERSLNGKQSLVFTLIKSFPALPVFAHDVGISVDGISEAMICVGIISSILIMLGGNTNSSPSSLLFFITWLCYLGCLLLGQTFLSFQWDILLVEVGFLCIFTTSASRAKDAMCNWTYRFLAFKLLFLAGVVKIQATCPTWEKLVNTLSHTAINMRYEYIYSHPSCQHILLTHSINTPSHTAINMRYEYVFSSILSTQPVNTLYPLFNSLD